MYVYLYPPGHPTEPCSPSARASLKKRLPRMPTSNASITGASSLLSGEEVSGKETIEDVSVPAGLCVVAKRRARGGSGLSFPLFLHAVPAGFPSPADDYVEKRLDINEALVNDEEATFFVRVAGDSMTGAGIHDGDILVVDRSVEPAEGDVVIAVLAGELTVKRYEVRSGQPYLVPEAETHDPIPVRKGQELRVWGVAQHVIHEVS